MSTGTALRALAETDLLAGVRVVELSTSTAGAYAGRLLSSLGAAVSRVDLPIEAATTTAAAPHLATWLHQGKKQLAQDDWRPHVSEAQLIVVEADPGRAAAFDIARDMIRFGRERDHQPVVVVLRHAVQGGRAIPGTALTISAWSGMSWSMGNKAQTPLTLPYDIGAYEGGIHACAAGLAALVANPAAPQLRQVDVSGRDVVAYFTGMITANFLPYERPWQREGARPPGSAGVYPASIFPCKDGHVVLMCRSQREWDIFIEGMGFPEWAQDERFRDPRIVARLHADEADTHLIPWIQQYTEQELLEFGTRLGLPIAPVRSVSDAIAEPQLAHRGFMTALPGSDLQVPNSPWKLYAPATPRTAERKWPIDAEASTTPGTLLTGLRVLDLSWVWSGPLVTSVLVDLGAEVLKVEHTENMDSSRTRGRARRGGVEVEGPEHEATPYFNQMNHGKRSITMNLKEQQAREIFLDLVEQCDIVVENMRPGALERLGLSYDVLAERNPGLVMLSMSMAGQTGPLSSMKGYAGIMAAMSGLESLIGYDEDNIVGSLAPAIGDPNASGHALSVLFAALYRRRETGSGAWIDLSQTEALMCLLAGPMIDSQLAGGRLDPPANTHPSFVPNGHFRCAGDDAWAAITVRSDREWSALVDLLATADAPADPKWATVLGRLQDAADVEAAVSLWVATHERDELVGDLLSRGIAAAPVMSFEDLISSDWKTERGLTSVVDHPYLGATEIFLVPWRFGGDGPDTPTPAPLLGSSTVPVLQELLGIPADRVAALQAEKVLY